jgi:hypothetical protein
MMSKRLLELMHKNIASRSDLFIKLHRFTNHDLEKLQIETDQEYLIEDQTWFYHIHVIPTYAWAEYAAVIHVTKETASHILINRLLKYYKRDMLHRKNPSNKTLKWMQDVSRNIPILEKTLQKRGFDISEIRKEIGIILNCDLPLL